MARPSNSDLIARVKELEAQLEAKPAEAAQPVSFRVKGLLKRIARHPEQAKDLAEQALGLMQ